MSDRDYYEVLGLTPGADGAMVDQAYWHLARKYQALAATNPRGRRLLDDLNEAYGVLGNPRLRREYDAFRDEVLVEGGVIRPVKARPRRKRAHQADEADHRGMARVRIEHWRTYATSAVIAALAFAGAWQGVNAAFVIAALLAGLAFSLTPSLRAPSLKLKRQLPDVSIGMPSLPAVSIPQIKTRKLSLPKLSELAIRDDRDEPLDPDELRASTAAVIARWRKSMGLRAIQPTEAGAESAPSTTLVDIVQSERELDESESEPLTAVLDILRGAHKKPAEAEHKTS